jgi:hypothetical protein
MNPFIFRSNKKIDITQYLPEYIRTSPSINLTSYMEVYEDYLNGMYEGTPSVEYDYTEVDDIDVFISEDSLYIQNVSNIIDDDTGDYVPVWNNVSNDSVVNIQNVSGIPSSEVEELSIPLGTKYVWSANIVGDGRISILEKIHRLIDLIDGTMVPDELIYEVANQVGYDKSTQLLNYNNYGNEPSLQYYSPETYLGIEDDFVNEKVRFIVDSLPQWYSQKITRRGLKIILFASNIIGNVATEYTKNYSTKLVDWDNINLRISDTTDENGRNIIEEDFEEFLKTDRVGDNKNEWYPTSHFNVWIDLNATSQYIDYDVLFGSGDNSISKILTETRPVNTVYEGLISLFRTRNQYYYNLIQYESVTNHSVGTVGPPIAEFLAETPAPLIP